MACLWLQLLPWGLEPLLVMSLPQRWPTASAMVQNEFLALTIVGLVPGQVREE